jgi:threonylcarbamoyladenosine tRNA methylthiotransferase MtaB
MKVSMLSLGCKVNQAEMSHMESALRGSGHEIVSLKENPDLCIINTCTVTSRSGYQSRQLIRRAARSGGRVVVTGCYSELNSEEVRSMEGVEAVIKNSNKSNIIKTIDCNNESTTLNYKGSRTRFFLKAQDGCDHSCSYCIIPKARGKSRSVSPYEIIGQIEQAADNGFKEVVLTGIHLGLYGLDIGTTLPSLLERALNETRIERIRLSSLEITEIDDRLLELVRDERICSHLHIPLQSGDDRVLELMNRPYNMSFFNDKIERVTKKLTDLALGTDVIAGFPYEGEEEFNNTMKMLNDLPFTYIHVFPYSRRPGTDAASMPDTVGDIERKIRASAMRRVSERKNLHYLHKHIGLALDVLIEESISETEARGTSSNYLKILVKGQDIVRGSIVPAMIEGVKDGILFGKPLSN